MTRDLKLIETLSGRIASRLGALPFEDGRHHRGVILCGTAERKGPAWVAKGACYSVLDGMPRFVPFEGLSCDGLDAISPADLARRLECSESFDFGTGKALPHWLAGVMPEEPIDLASGPDLFSGLAWGTRWDWGALLYDLASDADHAINDLAFPGLAFREAGRRCEPTVARARAIFLDALPVPVREAMETMRRTLPTYDPRVLTVLLRDVGGPAFEFARRHPLLAMRSLVDPEVAGRACRGDFEGALALSQRAELVGGWVLDHWRRHRKSADSVDGTRRGVPVDDALDCFGFIPREHLPMSPAEFAACVDACNWAQQISPMSFRGRHGPGLGDALPRAKGRWGHVVGQTARLSPGLVEIDALHGFAEVSWQAFGSFRHDLLMPALAVARKPLAQMDVFMRRPNAPNDGFELLTKGMGIPDRARLLDAYLKAKPAIAGVHGSRVLRGGVRAAVEAVPWINVGDVEVRPVSVHAGEEHGMPAHAKPPEGVLHLTLLVPAEAPNGLVQLRVHVRRADGIPATRFSYRGSDLDPGPGEACPHPVEREVVQAIVSHVGVDDAVGLGRWLIAVTGIEPRIAEVMDELRPQHEERLAGMLKAWRPALPRRFRSLGAGAFAQAIARELDLAHTA